MNSTFDILLRGGRVIDPAQDLSGNYDVAVKDGRIASVLPSIAPSSAKNVIDVSGKLVLPGLIDTHAHVFEFVTGRFGLEADLCGVRSGVTTLIDQGGPSCMTLPAFREFVVNVKKSRVLTFLSAYLVGGVGIQYQTHGNVTLAPIRSGIGLRLGANVGYLKYTRSPTWNPF